VVLVFLFSSLAILTNFKVILGGSGEAFSSAMDEGLALDSTIGEATAAPMKARKNARCMVAF
jgi:hypothetical protein